MKNVDWPLAVALVIVFVVMSAVRWRYFMSVRRRKSGSPPKPPRD